MPSTLTATGSTPEPRNGDLPHGVASLVADPGTSLETQPSSPDRLVVSATSPTGRPGLFIEVDLGSATGYWSPQRGTRTIPADWEHPVITSLVSSAPIGVLFDAQGNTLLGWASTEVVAELSVGCGVSEERKTFTVDIRPQATLDAPLLIMLDTSRDPLTDTVTRLISWVSDHCAGRPLTAPAVARRPVYSTWYTFGQDISADLVEAEAQRAAELGCGSVFIDDGWQQFGHGRGYQGCGDWLPDHDKFPDLASTVDRLRDQGSAVALWIAPLLLGADSAAFDSLRAYAPDHAADLNCFILDPRHRSVRDHLAATCVRLVIDYGVQVLKIDFLEQAMIYRGTPTPGDLADVGEAMQRLLQQIRRQLGDAGHSEIAFEFRQPYVSPAIARYGQILRANDCPGDSVTNRRAVIDCRLSSVGQLVHSDPMMWGVQGGAEAVAQQLYASWFSVPQISMRLGNLPADQSDALRRLLTLWSEHADVLLGGRLTSLGPEHGYLLVRAARPDLDRSVIVRYAPVVVDLDHDGDVSAETLIVNASSADRLVLRSPRSISGGLIRSAAGDPVATLDSRGPGILELHVPAFGSLTVRA